MKIVQIKPAKKHISIITLDDGTELILDSDFCAEQGLFTEMELSVSDCESLKRGSERKRAVSRSVWYIERCDITEKGLRDRLRRAGFSPDAVTFATDKMKEWGLINDCSFAQRFAEQQLSAGVSKRQVLEKLCAKGIVRETGRRVLEGLECDAQEQIKLLILKKYAKKLSEPEGVKKVAAALQRKGFSYSDIRAVLKNYSEEIEYSEE